MICPKCSGEMRTFDRLGIHVEQCGKCRGIFLDHGELDQIVATEQGGGAPPPLPGYPQAAPGHDRGYRDSPAPWGGRGYDDSPRPYGSRRRRKSILEQLFD